MKKKHLLDIFHGDHGEKLNKRNKNVNKVSPVIQTANVLKSIEKYFHIKRHKITQM